MEGVVKRSVSSGSLQSSARRADTTTVPLNWVTCRASRERGSEKDAQEAS